MGKRHSLLNKEITVRVDLFLFYFHRSHMQDCSTEPLAIFRFSFLAVNVLPSGNQQTDLRSTGWLSTGTETVPANEKTPETDGFHSFIFLYHGLHSHPVYAHLLSHRTIMIMDFFSLYCFLQRSVVLSIAQPHTNKRCPESLHEQTSA